MTKWTPIRLSREQTAVTASVLLLAVACIFGGANRYNELGVLTVELASLPFLVVAILNLPGLKVRGATVPLLILLATLAVPLLQIVPLPPAIWTQLPGRQELAAHLALAGLPIGWAPLSLAPAETLDSVLFLIPAATVFLWTLAAPLQTRRVMAGALVVLALASLALGLLQIGVSIHSRIYLHSNSNAGSAVGFFANRNHQATMLLCATPMALAVALTSYRQWAISTRLYLAALIVFVFISGLVAVQSRAGILLAGPALLAAIGLIAADRKLGTRRRIILGILGGLLIAVFAIVSVARPGFLVRFSQPVADEARLTVLPSELVAGSKFSPLGAGIGSFEPVFATVEPLETVDPTFMNNAHNDYIELWMATGLVGPAVLLVFLVWFFTRAWSLWSRKDGDADLTLGRAGTIVILLILLHSAVDYPLRIPTLAAVFAFACGLMVAPPAPRNARQPSGR